MTNPDETEIQREPKTPQDPARLIRWQRITIAVLLCGMVLCGAVIKGQMRRAGTAEHNAERRMLIARAVSNTLWESNLRLEHDHALNQLSQNEYRDHLSRYERKYGEIDPPQRDSQPVDHWAYTSVDHLSTMTSILPDPMTQQAVFAAQGFVRATNHRAASAAENPLLLGFTGAIPDQNNADPNRWLVVGTALQDGVSLQWRVVEHRDTTNHWSAESVQIGLR